MSFIATRRKPDYTLPQGIADAFASAGRELAPKGTSLPDLRTIPADADWLRTHLAHRLERWVYTATEPTGEPVKCHWVTFKGLYDQIDGEYRERRYDWQFPTDTIRQLVEAPGESPVPDPLKWGFEEGWDDRAQRDVIGERYHDGLALMTLQAASTAAHYLTCTPEQMTIGLPSLGYCMASTLAYAVQVFDEPSVARDKWLDECNRIRRIHGLNGGHS
jgi:hypothetical protein